MTHDRSAPVDPPQVRGQAGDPPPGAEESTRPSIFVRLNAEQPAPRELAWRQFYQRYAPVIASYARRRGADRQRAEEVVQEVVAGFFSASPRFIYDPSRGRFRAYLMRCVEHALRRMRRQAGSTDAPHAPQRDRVPIDELPAPEPGDEQLWEQLWQHQILRRALDRAREHYTNKGKLETFLAFEQNVIFDRPAAEVAEALDLSVASVHAAKARVTEKLREIRAALEHEE